MKHHSQAFVWYKLYLVVSIKHREPGSEGSTVTALVLRCMWTVTLGLVVLLPLPVVNMLMNAVSYQGYVGILSDISFQNCNHTSQCLLLEMSRPIGKGVKGV